LQLDVDFADAGLLTASSGLKFGDLTICGLTTDTSLNGMTVRDLLTIDNALLGGGSSSGFTGADIFALDPLTEDVASSFEGGIPSTWAQAHLENGSCGWHTGDLLTYSQGLWSGTGGGATLLTNNYGTVYYSTGGLFDIGSSGCTASTFFIQFDSAATIEAFLPQTGTAGRPRS